MKPGAKLVLGILALAAVGLALAAWMKKSQAPPAQPEAPKAVRAAESTRAEFLAAHCRATDPPFATIPRPAKPTAGQFRAWRCRNGIVETYDDGTTIEFDRDGKLVSEATLRPDADGGDGLSVRYETWAKARGAGYAGRYVDAIALYDQGIADLAKDPRRAELERERTRVAPAAALSLLAQAAEAEKAGDLDKALSLCDAAGVLGGDAKGARERIAASIEKRRAEAEAGRKEDQRREVLAEAGRIERAGKLEEAIAKYDEALAIADDPIAKESRARCVRMIEERKTADATAQEKARFEGIVDEAKQFAAQGEYEKAIAKYDEAIAMKDDPELRAARAKAQNDGKKAAFLAKWRFAPRVDELPEEEWGRVEAAGALFLAAWADRDDPKKNLAARKKDLADADAAFKALPADLKKHPAFLFLNGAEHYLVAMGTYDDFLARRDALRDLTDQEKLTKETVPVYNGELVAAEKSLKAAREATDGHFATCVIEDLARAWRSDKKTSEGGKQSLAEDFAKIEPLTPFDEELRKWYAQRGIFRAK